MPTLALEGVTDGSQLRVNIMPRDTHVGVAYKVSTCERVHAGRPTRKAVMTTPSRRSGERAGQPAQRQPNQAAGRGGAGFVRPNIPNGFAFFAAAEQSITKWRDCILFKDTTTNIAAQGWFDDRWRLTPTDADKLRVTCVIVISAPAR